MVLASGDFVENFTYDKWQAMIKAGTLDPVKLAQFEQSENKNSEEVNDD